MTKQQFDEVRSNLLKTAKAVSDSKSASYATDGDVLSHFKKSELGLTPFQVLGTFMMKHVTAVQQAIAENPQFPVDKSESMQGRLVDIINYAVLCAALLDEYSSKKLASIGKKEGSK